VIQDAIVVKVPHSVRIGWSYICKVSKVEILDGREVPLGRYTTVQRMLPHRARRTVGAWCFLDHFGPQSIINMPGMQVPPHPHIGLQTVTWLLEGEVLHRDSLGSEQRIHPGELNLMTSGRGIAHSEESPRDRPPSMHGLQLWVALPSGVRDGAARFEHFSDLPRRTAGGARMTVVMGEFDALVSPATAYTPLVGVELDLAPGTTVELPLRADFEHAVVAMSGAATVDGDELRPHALLYLGADRSFSVVRAGGDGARLFLFGGEPLEEELVMWWNFVGRSHEEIAQARADWAADVAQTPGRAERFGVVHGYAGDPLPAPPLPATRLVPRGRTGPSERR
jgi:redox-sensitive bicupin YhaK (pirin superfamily)